MIDREPKKTDPVRQQAIEWFAAMQSDVQAVEGHQAFRRWLSEAPEHQRAYDEICMLWEHCAEFEQSEVVARVRGDSTGCAAADRSGFFASGWLRSRTGLQALAASIFVLSIGAIVLFGATGRGDIYETAIGNMATVTLKDMSVVKLDTDTRLRVVFEEDRRLIYLDRGQAHFSVAHDTARPFTVFAGDISVTALGTEFDVRKEDASTGVTLIEGSVLVMPDKEDEQKSAVKETRLVPGQKLEYSRDGAVDVIQVELSKVTAWQRGKLIFDDTPLADAVSEINRYSDSKIVIGDNRLKELRISAVFTAGQTRSMVAALDAYFPIETIHKANGNIVLVSAQQKISTE